MTANSELLVNADAPASAESPLAYLIGRLVSLRFVIAALRRRRKLLLATAAIGLLVGASYQLVVPRQYQATATLYLAHVPGTDDGIDMTNDLALLQTRAIADRAIALLGEPQINPAKLLGKAPGIADSDNVLTIAVGGPSKAEAIRRVNAVASALLSFRSQQAAQQANATIGALQKQINTLSAQVKQLIKEINSPATPATQLSNLIVDRSAETSEMVTLEENLQQEQTNALAVADGSRVLTPGSSASSSTAKVLTVDGLSGLAGGLTLSVGFVMLQALLSDRIRKRDDVTALLGAPVEFSASVRPPRTRRRRWVRRMLIEPDPEVKALATYLRRRRDALGDRSTLLVVAADRAETPVAALGLLAARFVSEGRSVAVVDLTDGQLLAKVTGTILKAAGRQAAGNGGGKIKLVELPPQRVRTEEDRQEPAELGTDIVLALASVYPGFGAWHLGWAREAIVTVSAGRSSAQHLSATAELVRAAGVLIAGAALLEADADDETVGLLRPGDPVFSHAGDEVRLSSTWP